MSTYITVTSGTGALVTRVKQVQQANREAQLQRESDTALQAQIDNAIAREASQTERPIGGNPDTSIERRPSAQREAGAVMGVTYSLNVDSTEARTVKLRVGTTDFALSAEIGEIFDPGLVTINDVTLPNSGSGGDAVEAVGGLQYYDSFFTNPYQAWSGLDASGIGAPPLLYQGSVPPPASSQVDVWTASYDTFSADCSATLVLPAGGQNCVFIYVHNKIKAFNTYRRIQRRTQERENPRTETDLVDRIGTGTWYDMRQTNRVIFEYVDTQQFAAYQIYAFLVTSKAVSPITVPSEALTYIQALCPPITVNATAQKLTESGGGQVSGYGPGSSSYFFTLPNVYDQAPAVDQAAWQDSTVYGTYPVDNDVLAKQFGIGWLQYSDHSGNFFSPAVFAYLKGGLDLQAADAKQYAAMRLQLGGLPPRKYLAPCVQTCATEDTEFYSTKTEPVSITTALDETLFRLERRYAVKKGEVSAGDLYFCWDWDKRNYCRQQLSSLGFSGLAFAP